VKIGARELATDLRHTRAIVEALGDRASIRVDVNQAWDATAARKAAANWRRWASTYRTAGQRPRQRGAGAPSQHIETAILADEAVATLTMVIAWRSRALPALMR
jgi:muconate cycloisomerase